MKNEESNLVSQSFLNLNLTRNHNRLYRRIKIKMTIKIMNWLSALEINIDFTGQKSMLRVP